MNTRIQILILSTLVMLMAQSVSPSASSSADDALFELVVGRKDAHGRDFPHLLDPPLWKATTYLLEGESHAQMLALLDRMLAEPPGNMEHTRRALTQHLLWQVFDWSAEVDQPYAPERVLLRRKLADVIRHLALTTDEIKALPPALPAGRATPGNAIFAATGLSSDASMNRCASRRCFFRHTATTSSLREPTDRHERITS